MWPRFGDVSNYAEPFAGSLAVLLNRPTAPGNEIINDKDCYLVNAWRAVQQAPEEVAKWCDTIIFEAELHARHRWLHARHEFRERMVNDPDYYDARVAGYWIWGLSCWIGDNFCRPAVNNSVPHLTGGKGVARQVPHLTGGMGETEPGKKIPNLKGGKGVNSQTQNLVEWFKLLSMRIRFAKICCGEWDRVLTKAATYGQGLTAVFLDPPYDAGGHDEVYGNMECAGLSAKVRQWAIENGENPLLRIAICGYANEHKMPDNWQRVAWKAMGGYAAAAGNTANSEREMIWFSPHCLQPVAELFAPDIEDYGAEELIDEPKPEPASPEPVAAAEPPQTEAPMPAVAPKEEPEPVAKGFDERWANFGRE